MSSTNNSLQIPANSPMSESFSPAFMWEIKPIPRRRMYVRHATKYNYNTPIERSIHQLHLKPITDAKQQLIAHRILCNPAAPTMEYEDVFGNATSRFELTQSYSSLELEAESVVDIVDEDPFAFTNQSERALFPLVWMPWESTMLAPFLTPLELPETQIRELSDYAMSFVERNNRDLMETLFAMNLGIFREYSYIPGSTAIETTPYEVLVSKRGVCQDFSSLFICLARLLGVPARYVCGYVHCPQINVVQSLQTHAWVELYIPKVGWKGFDPTNGILPRVDHIRVAVGRHYVDTTPTSGTLYTSGTETMTTEVTVKEITPASTN